ncbi:hypothetical protein BX661DRAFT_168367 [Kickxella alabastrina]|uniref:uncharacterized protein n=1 Tax=Kickxella alabastrina TaxID=61397 RepID=UPI00222110B3|nr:uncharacterized protein BX661DRAFT_168367 [Kickxella alabastrina]KAI7835209.1 hypothetical protein BX661DRAFT_168367 [Kickxella alabastrina]
MDSRRPESFSLFDPQDYDDNDSYRTPDGQHYSGQRHPELGQFSIGNTLSNPAAVAAPVGRRLNLEGIERVAAPQFSMYSQHAPTSPQHDSHSSAFATPIMHQHHYRMGAGTQDMNMYETPVATKQTNVALQSEAEMKTELVDEDFILNLRQEGDLARLTRKAVEDTKTAWKKETMQRLRAQVASLDDDAWMYQSGK